MPEVIPASQANRRRTFIATSAGHVIEFFDFAAYGLVAIYLGHQFFPESSPSIQMINTFAIFALTFIFRPLGAAIFGPLADRIGRLNVLVTALLMMAASTLLIGLLPTYDSIGVAAPILLVVLRLVQGLSAGGEQGSAVPYMLEHSAPGRKAFGSSWLTVAGVVGFLLGTSVAVILSQAVSEETMYDWGWRVPFLVAGPLGFLGIYIRLKLEESHEFQALKESGQTSKRPLRDSFRYPKQMAIAIALGSLHSATFYIVSTYMITYIGVTVGFGGDVALLSVLIAMAAALVLIPTVSALSDRIGRRPVIVTTTVLLILTALPLFAMIRTSAAMAMVGMALFGILLGSIVSVTLVTASENFPTAIRGAGFSISYAVAAAGVGGTAPLISAWLVDATGSNLAPAVFLTLVGICGLVAGLALQDRSQLEEESSAPSLTSVVEG
ncbi:MFS transporter [Streptomyces sp. GD-15H]|uniref:MFS transporter n=1 Tax=Streptomyces sp. GD-15H TaxID=3129112 RepID=UPI0032549AC6